MKKLLLIVVVLTLIIGIGFYLVFFPSWDIHGKLSPQNVTAVHDTAYNFFQACSAGDWDKAKLYCHYVDRLKSYLDGMQFIELGKPYTAIWYPGVFIPYKIKLKNGEIKSFRIAIRNDNPQHQWQVDGGL